MISHPSPHRSRTSALTLALVLAFGTLGAGVAVANDLGLGAVAPRTPETVPVVGNANDGLAPGETLVPAPPAAQGLAAGRANNRPVPQPARLTEMPAGLGFEPPSEDVERAVYRRAPLRIVLAPQRERMVSFPGPVALHTPDGVDALVQIQIIERTVYVRALAPFGPLRIVAEDLSTGRQIPLDLVAEAKTNARMPLEIVLPGEERTGAGSPSHAPAGSTGGPQAPQNLDMVALTRYAAQSLYAPRRLVPSQPGVRALPLRPVPVDGLYRGWKVQTTPIGAWRSGQLYVTAVQFVNQSARAHDVDLDDLRGQWLAATAQHKRLLGDGSDGSSTTVYLVCDRPFDACRER